MGIKPQEIDVLELAIRVYDFSSYATAWHRDKRLGNLSQVEGDTWRTESGFVGSRQECLEQLVRAFRISNQTQPAAPPMLDRKEFVVLDEKVWVHTFQLSPTLAVWTDGGQPIGTLMPDGEHWRRSLESEADSLQGCLESMVREFHGAQRGVTLV